MEPLREDLNARLDCSWEEWDIPREASETWPAEAAETHRLWWEVRIALQQEIDDSIAAKADYEYLYDKPQEDKRKVRVAGPFTVESLSPHRAGNIERDHEHEKIQGRDEDDPFPQTDAQCAGRPVFFQRPANCQGFSVPRRRPRIAGVAAPSAPAREPGPDSKAGRRDVRARFPATKTNGPDRSPAQPHGRVHEVCSPGGRRERTRRGRGQPRRVPAPTPGGRLSVPVL